MTYEQITELVSGLKEKYGTSDPERLCEALDISVLDYPMGTHEKAIKGFILSVDGVSTITVNSDLRDPVRRIIVAHELCHALVHCGENLCAYHELTLFDEISQQEKEANLFAAELLLDDSDVLDALNSDTTFFNVAASLYVPVELLDFKFRIMKWKGYKLAEPPVQSRNNFLKEIKTDNVIQ